MEKKIGILGGTFDPPHYGHLLIAEEAMCQCELDEIWFIPSQVPPHKEREDLTLSEDRMKMVELAIYENDNFFLSTVELEREGRSYTVDTMRLLTEQYPTYQFYFIIGGDMIDFLPKWESINELIQLVTFIGVKRPGYPSESPYPKHVIEIEAPQVDISSSDIRERVAEGKNIRYLLPDNVRVYIEERGLYGQK
ncbi:nicotinate-nucleotide adenylyltransferase [Bacillus sp. FJAT-45350]|uniref:nicotinate-nucleotide adenylyltransferase n=1 Tax=Bacillus sp. FJAT-45350 TaxID=2011014 RepID=UPI000BB8C4CA|nr:nicotinate-nucleotide adenylyltransferase [Bacillus sp. FJAT-45350]